MIPKLKKCWLFACNSVISSHRNTWNTSVESSNQWLHFILLRWWALNNSWGHYNNNHENFMISNYSVQSHWPLLFYVATLWNCKLIKVCWKSRWSLNRNLLTVACNCSPLVSFGSFSHLRSYFGRASLYGFCCIHHNKLQLLRAQKHISYL